MAPIKSLSRRIDSVRGNKLHLELSDILVLVFGMELDVVADNGTRKLIRRIVICLVSRSGPFDQVPRRPHGVGHRNQRRINVIAKMQIDALHRSRPTAFVVAVDGDHQAVALLDIILYIVSQVDGIEKGFRSRRIFETVGRLFQLFIVHRLRGIPHDSRVDPQVNSFKLFGIDRIAEAHHKAVGTAIGILGTLAKHRKIRYFSIKQELNRAVVIGTAHQGRKQSNSKRQKRRA